MDSNQVGYDQARQGQVHEAVNDSNPMKFLLTPEEKKQADYERKNGTSYQEYFQPEIDEKHRRAFKRMRERSRYSPVISDENSRNLRRMAWAARQPMTKTLDEIIILVGKQIDREKVCKACSDKSFCPECLFRK